MRSTLDKAAVAVLCALLAFQAGARAQDAAGTRDPAQPVEGAVATAQAGDAEGGNPPAQPVREQVAASQDVAAADPAVWGPYAQLVGRTFAGETLAGSPNYASATRSIQWEVPGEVMVETGIQADGSEMPQMRILPAGPGKLEFDVRAAPNSTGQVADAGSALKFSLPFGWENVVRLLDDDSYEMRTLKRGDLQAHAVYRDVASAAQQQRAAELAAEEATADESARNALRAAGIPDAALVDAPAERVLAYQEPVRGPSATLRVSRANGSGRGACHAAVYINGRWAARLDRAEAATFRVPAGDVRVGVGDDPQSRGSCGFGQAGGRIHETVLAKGEALHVQVSPGGQPFREALMPSAQ